MPEYSYTCTKCNFSFSLISSIKSYTEHPICSKCSGSCCRDYGTDLITLNSSVKKSDSELKTIGDLAQRNSDRMSTDEKYALYKKHNSYKDEQDLKPLPTGMSRVKKGPKIKWPGTSGLKKKRDIKK